MKNANGHVDGARAEAAYASEIAAWRAWLSQSGLDIEDGARDAAAHAAALTGRLGVTDSDDSVAGAEAVMHLSAAQRDGVAAIDPAQPDSAVLAMRGLLAAGWRPNLQSAYARQLAAAEQVHAVSQCEAFHWGTRQVSTWTAGGLSPIGLILALITIPIAIARQAEARRDAWRPLSNSKGILVITDKRLLRIGSDNTSSSIPYSALQSFAVHDQDGGLQLGFNDRRFLYRVPQPRLCYELLLALQAREAASQLDVTETSAQLRESLNASNQHAPGSPMPAGDHLEHPMTDGVNV